MLRRSLSVILAVVYDLGLVWTDTDWSHRRTEISVEYDDITAAAVKPFDLAPTDQLGFRPWRLPPLPSDFQIGVIVGASGSGKSVLLREFGGEQPVHWERIRSIASRFETPERAAEMLYAAGLSTIPT